MNLLGLDFGIQLKRSDSLVVGGSHKFHRPQPVSAGHGFELEEQWIDAVWQYEIFLFVKAT